MHPATQEVSSLPSVLSSLRLYGLNIFRNIVPVLFPSPRLLPFPSSSVQALDFSLSSSVVFVFLSFLLFFLLHSGSGKQRPLGRCGPQFLSLSYVSAPLRLQDQVDHPSLRGVWRFLDRAVDWRRPCGAMVRMGKRQSSRTATCPCLLSGIEQQQLVLHGDASRSRAQYGYQTRAGATRVRTPSPCIRAGACVCTCLRLYREGESDVSLLWCRVSGRCE